MDGNQLMNDEVTPGRFMPRLVRNLKPASQEPDYREFMGMATMIASASMRRLISVTARVGRTGSPVLISGESGTDKEFESRVGRTPGSGADALVGCRA